MLTDFIEKLRKKPEASRALFLWASTAIIMFLIIVLWLTFGIRQNPAFQTEENVNVSQQKEDKMAKLLNIFNEAKKDLLYAKEEMSEKMGDFLSGKNDPKQVPEDLKEYLPQENLLESPPLILPKTD